MKKYYGASAETVFGYCDSIYKDVQFIRKVKKSCYNNWATLSTYRTPLKVSIGNFGKWTKQDGFSVG